MADNWERVRVGSSPAVRLRDFDIVSFKGLKSTEVFEPNGSFIGRLPLYDPELGPETISTAERLISKYLRARLLEMQRQLEFFRGRLPGAEEGA